MGEDAGATRATLTASDAETLHFLEELSRAGNAQTRERIRTWLGKHTARRADAAHAASTGPARVQGAERRRPPNGIGKVLPGARGVTGVFTDGSATPNPGRGGWAWVWVQNGRIFDEYNGEAPDTTNNRMELQALIEAFRMLPDNAELDVVSDSELCVRTINEWAPAWRKAGWRRKRGAIANLDLVKRLLELAEAHPGCNVKWTRGHAADACNEYADQLASWRSR